MRGLRSSCLTFSHLPEGRELLAPKPATGTELWAPQPLPTAGKDDDTGAAAGTEPQSPDNSGDKLSPAGPRLSLVSPSPPKGAGAGPREAPQGWAVDVSCQGAGCRQEAWGFPLPKSSGCWPSYLRRAGARWSACRDRPACPGRLLHRLQPNLLLSGRRAVPKPPHHASAGSPIWAAHAQPPPHRANTAPQTLGLKATKALDVACRWEAGLAMCSRYCVSMCVCLQCCAPSSARHLPIPVLRAGDGGCSHHVSEPRMGCCHHLGRLGNTVDICSARSHPVPD